MKAVREPQSPDRVPHAEGPGYRGAPLARSGYVGLLIAFLFVTVLALNRGATKIPVPPVFLLDLVMLLAIVFSARFLRIFAKASPLFLLLAVGLGWLAYEMYIQEFGALNARRFGVVWYSFLSILIICWAHSYYRFIRRHILSIGAIVLLFAGSRILPDVHATLSAQTLAFMFFVVVLVGAPRRLLLATFLLIAFLLVASGTLGDGSPYRAPLMGFLLASAAVVARHALRFAVANGRLPVSYPAVAACLVLAGVLAVAATEPGRQIAYDFGAGVQGVFGDERRPGAAEGRLRGDAVGTASDRLLFWAAIIEHNAEEPRRLLLGNGHSRSFMEATGVYEVFHDLELVEPHNSFMGVYFRYGALGLVALIWLLVWSRQVAHRYGGEPNPDFLLACTALALVYVSFEVALESPHGSLLFWTLWLAPYFVGCSSRTYAAPRELSGPG
jgi:hypothetical protein